MRRFEVTSIRVRPDISLLAISIFSVLSFGAKYRELTIGTVCVFDDSPVKIFANDTCKAAGVYARCASYYGTDATIMSSLPVLSMSSRHTFLGLLGSLNLADLRLD